MVRREVVSPQVHMGKQKSPITVPLIVEGCQAVQSTSISVSSVSGRPSGSVDFGLPQTKLLDIAIGRSGDKGGTANIAIIARRPEFYADILNQVTAEVIYSAFRHFITPGGTVTRFEVPGVNAVNFVLTKSLGGGGLSSLRLDRQAKSYAQIALSTVFIYPSRRNMKAQL
ncbi:DUF1446-domain-containing [Fusarium albosuccineum]|uniref:DUF1446-domain-containing n=1 Tax=Fusarium albosuccineum TaxID=1237068 RepID=A0A8H4P527_9HYPO|nr:DUF1446-domain-containing [Fusarium albosuccineum]